VSYTDIGEFTIGFSTNMQNAPKVLEEIEGELVKIREEGISPDELALAKSKFRGSYVLARESLGWKMARMALQEMTFGRLIPDEEILDRVRGVRLADVHRVASEMLDSSRFTWAGVGPALQNALFQGFTFTF
jgi:predicted Zn-dependent peptidase